MSSDSGGFTVRNTNDLSGGIQKIANETQAYYLLGYIPSNTARDGKFRKIQVKLANGKGLQVRARKGYYAPSDTGKSAMAPKKGVDPVIQSALDSPWAEDAIPLRMTHFIGDEKTLGKAAVLVTTEVDIRALEFEEKDGRSLADLQFLLVVAHRESGEFFRYDQGVSMKLQPATRERFNRFWYPIVRDFELKSGDYQAKIVVRDTRTGRVGTVIHEFDVPPLGRAARLDAGAERHARPGARGGGRPRRDPHRPGPPRVRLGLRPPLPVRGLRGEEGREDGHAPRDAGLRGDAARRQRVDGDAAVGDQPDLARPGHADVRLPAHRRAARRLRDRDGHPGRHRGPLVRDAGAVQGRGAAAGLGDAAARRDTPSAATPPAATPPAARRRQPPAANEPPGTPGRTRRQPAACHPEEPASACDEGPHPGGSFGRRRGPPSAPAPAPGTPPPGM